MGSHVPRQCGATLDPVESNSLVAN